MPSPPARADDEVPVDGLERGKLDRDPAHALRCEHIERVHHLGRDRSARDQGDIPSMFGEHAAPPDRELVAVLEEHWRVVASQAQIHRPAMLDGGSNHRTRGHGIRRIHDDEARHGAQDANVLEAQVGDTLDAAGQTAETGRDDDAVVRIGHERSDLFERRLANAA